MNWPAFDVTSSAYSALDVLLKAEGIGKVLAPTHFSLAKLRMRLFWGCNPLVCKLARSTTLISRCYLPDL